MQSKSKHSLDRGVLSAPAAETLDAGRGPSGVASNSQFERARQDEEQERLVEEEEEEEEEEEAEEKLTVWQRVKNYFVFVKVLLGLAFEDLTMLMQHTSAEHHEIVEQIQSEIRTKMAAKLKWVLYSLGVVHSAFIIFMFVVLTFRMIIRKRKRGLRSYFFIASR